jgi:hypothetical protein
MKQEKKLYKQIAKMLDKKENWRLTDSRCPDLVHKTKDITLGIPDIIDVFFGETPIRVGLERIYLPCWLKIKVNWRVRKLAKKLKKEAEIKKAENFLNYLKNGENNEE